MNSPDAAIVNSYHQMRIKLHGAGSVEALGWLDDDSQLSRFGMLAAIGDMNNCTVLDAGCGHGDLFAFLSEKYDLGHYTGIDFNEAFISIANKKYCKQAEVSFEVIDFGMDTIPAADFILLSGSLNYRNNDPAFIYKTIAKLFAACHVALGFNLLSNIYDPLGILVAYDMDNIAKYCRTLTQNVALHHHYADGDFTIWMYK